MKPFDTYARASYAASKLITNAYSTSFGLSITLFAASLRPHIYAIYGLVRIADEIVDTYDGPDKGERLDALEQETMLAVKGGYSANPIVHAYAQTARRYDIGDDLLAPFFASMRMDLAPRRYDQAAYETYIDGSAEVVGLMCLKVFTDDSATYEALVPGARSLGAAYQKVNFLRDIAADSDELGRWYFPNGSKETFDEAAKQNIVEDIERDLSAAYAAIVRLPESSRAAVLLSYRYYERLLRIIKRTPAHTLLKQRVRVDDAQKLALLLRTKFLKTVPAGKERNRA